MAARWVYRRPPAIFRRRFVPPTFAAHHVVVRRRARAQSRRRTYPLRRRVVVILPAAFAKPLVLRHRLAVLRRVRRVRRRAPVMGVAAAAAGTGAAPVLRRAGRRRNSVRIRHRPAQVFGFEVPRPVIPAVPQIRLHKAIARIRRSLQARLRWKPRPEEIPPLFVTEPVEQSLKGRISAPGLTRGRVIGGR